MKSRRKAREAALQALYQCDALDEWTAACVELYFSEFGANGDEASPETHRANLEFARELVYGVLEQRQFVDGQIGLASTHWSLGRMARVDRNILRVAAFELAFLGDIPSSVSINEAIEVAKRYGSDDSPMFINGVLDKVASHLHEHPELTPAGGGKKRAVNQ